MFQDPHADLILFRRWIRDCTPEDALLLPYTLVTYRRLLIKTLTRLGVPDIGIAPHWPRAGFATEHLLQSPI